MNVGVIPSISLEGEALCGLLQPSIFSLYSGTGRFLRHGLEGGWFPSTNPCISALATSLTVKRIFFFACICRFVVAVPEVNRESE